jgi:hypothetical protein
MTETVASPSTGIQVPADVQRDFDSAEQAFQIVQTRRHGDGPPDKFEFGAHLQFLLTIGYITKPQALALKQWFDNEGMIKLPDEPGPEGMPSPTMYEILATKIHFGTPEPVRRVIESRASVAGDSSSGRRPTDRVDGEEELAADVLGFFTGLLGGVADAITTVLDGVTTTLQAGTDLVHAASELVHELHDLVTLKP